MLQNFDVGRRMFDTQYSQTLSPPCRSEARQLALRSHEGRRVVKSGSEGENAVVKSESVLSLLREPVVRLRGLLLQ